MRAGRRFAKVKFESTSHCNAGRRFISEEVRPTVTRKRAERRFPTEGRPLSPNVGGRAFAKESFDRTLQRAERRFAQESSTDFVNERKDGFARRKFDD
ncbi:hypothetical protein AVEN_188643-1 [Araneus ventricosus]|uniref:Uncharacterized protein n=1 Tax=Araneus ventricosus TaxID=182803 RepID=A0A4Y2RWX6_ARAVE|nr:hypothetical protein AVEN_188643-1 [Araneus ventricosus]